MADPQSQPEPAAEGTAPPDPRDLVRRMAEAGEWPEPALLEQIAAAGESAMEPLLKLLRSRPRGWPDEALLANAMGMLETLGARSAIPELAAVAREYLNETAQDAAATLARLGDEGFDALLSVIQDPGVAGYHRCHLVDAAIENALADPDRRRRLAEALRSLFDRALSAAREARSFENELLEAAAAASSDGEDATFDEIEEIAVDELDDTDREEELTEEPRSDQEGPAWEALAENEVPPDLELGFLAVDLCRLADPLARELLLSAFDEGLIDASVIDRKGVEISYRTAPQPPDPAIPWLVDYRESYRLIQENQRRVASIGEITFPSRTSYPSFDREDPQAGLPSPPLQPVEPIRYEGPRIGRNDPCWCGSGKKYKKCHWGKDG